MGRRKGSTKKNSKSEGGVYDYVDPLTFADIYGEPADKADLLQQQQLTQQQPTLVRRVASAIFNPTTSTIFTIVAIPVILAASYWLFVVNGPTPVVKARIEDVPDYIDSDEFDFYGILNNIIRTYFIPVIQQPDD